jgi:hypothetical protein
MTDSGEPQRSNSDGLTQFLNRGKSPIESGSEYFCVFDRRSSQLDPEHLCDGFSERDSEFNTADVSHLGRHQKKMALFAGW